MTFSCATFSNTEKFADCCCKACELSAHSEACECARHVGACAAAPEAAMPDPKFDIAGCSRDWCTSPDGYGGYDCAAPPAIDFAAALRDPALLTAAAELLGNPEALRELAASGAVHEALAAAGVRS